MLDYHYEYKKIYKEHFPDLDIDDEIWSKLFSLRKKSCRECLYCRNNLTCSINDKYINSYAVFPFNGCPDLSWDSIFDETSLHKEIKILEGEYIHDRPEDSIEDTGL